MSATPRRRPPNLHIPKSIFRCDVIYIYISHVTLVSGTPPARRTTDTRTYIGLARHKSGWYCLPDRPNGMLRQCNATRPGGATLPSPRPDYHTRRGPCRIPVRQSLILEKAIKTSARRHACFVGCRDGMASRGPFATAQHRCRLAAAAAAAACDARARRGFLRLVRVHACPALSACTRGTRTGIR
jgi:hypothetical protein